MILKKGITGFFDVRDESKDETGYYDFKKICYSIRMNNLKLLEVCNSDNARYLILNINRVNCHSEERQRRRIFQRFLTAFGMTNTSAFGMTNT